jgi:dTMP kinase
MSGRFITFEGIDGAGKSTHIEWYAQRLRERGIRTLVTREPGGSPLGERLRELLLSEPMTVATETMLMFAARNEHLERSIRPALADGTWVICDRFTDSTYAYQGGGRGVPLEQIEALERWVHGELQPDRSYLFDLPAELAAARRAGARTADRFEAEDRAFFERVRAAYLHRVTRAAQRFVVIDSRQDIESIRNQLEQDIASL